MKKWIDILGIVLPAIIVIVGIARLFSSRLRSGNAIIMFCAFLLLLSGLVRFFFFSSASRSSGDEPAPEPLQVKGITPDFNASLVRMMDAYYKVAEVLHTETAFSAAIDSLAIEMDELKVTELQVDSLIYQTAIQPVSNIKTLLLRLKSSELGTSRDRTFHELSGEMLTLLSAVRYQKAVVYWMECENGLGQDEPGNWLSQSIDSKNPFGGDEKCAEVKTKIDFVADSIKGR